MLIFNVVDLAQFMGQFCVRESKFVVENFVLVSFVMVLFLMCVLAKNVTVGKFLSAELQTVDL